MNGQQTELYISDTKAMTLEDVLNLFRHLTGREPTPEEVAEAKAEWESDDGKSKG